MKKKLSEWLTEAESKGHTLRSFSNMLKLNPNLEIEVEEEHFKGKYEELDLVFFLPNDQFIKQYAEGKNTAGGTMKMDGIEGKSL